MPVEKFSVSLMPDTMEELQRRIDAPGQGMRSHTINESIERYFWLLAQERRALRQRLSDGEIGLLCDILNGTLFSHPFTTSLLPLQVSDALEDGYDRKWQVDGPALVEKLKMLTDAGNLAVIDAVEVWWNRIAKGESIQPTIAEVLR